MTQQEKKLTIQLVKSSNLVHKQQTRIAVLEQLVLDLVWNTHLNKNDKLIIHNLEDKYGILTHSKL
jgi:hypothetical protein